MPKSPPARAAPRGRKKAPQNSLKDGLFAREAVIRGEDEIEFEIHRQALLGRMILEDFSKDAVLERLLRYERRIENSLYRTLNELRRAHDQVQKAAQVDVSILERWREEDWEAKRRGRLPAVRPRRFLAFRPAQRRIPRGPRYPSYHPFILPGFPRRPGAGWAAEGRNAENEPNFGGSLKLEVSRLKRNVQNEPNLRPGRV